MFTTFSSLITRRRVIVTLVASSVTANYFHQKHQYDKEFWNRANPYYDSGKKLSGVYIRQRQAFNILRGLHWLFPYHQSLEIPIGNGKTRHVGLGRSPGHTGWFDRISEFVLHIGAEYAFLNPYDVRIPIEFWVDYARKYGHFPENIDTALLNKITRTAGEDLGDRDGEHVIPFYRTVFFSFFRDETGHLNVSTCRSTVMGAIRLEEQIRLNRTYNPVVTQ